jgi:uncharacterized LabA/DUF88 family protein
LAQFAGTHPLQRALVVDGQAMFYAQQKLGWFFDPRHLLALASRGEQLELAAAFWYVGLKDPTDQRPFRDALSNLGFTVRTKPLRELAAQDPEQRQFARANLEVEMAIDLMTISHRIDELWLLSGSRDLERLVEVLRARGLKVVVIHTDGMASRELRNAADRFLDLAELRRDLEKAEAVQAPVFDRSA